MAWLPQTFGIPETIQNFLEVFVSSHSGLGKEGDGRSLDLTLSVLHPQCVNGLSGGSERSRLPHAKRCQHSVRDRSSGQGASRCHCHAAETDPSATAGWGHLAQSQLAA